MLRLRRSTDQPRIEIVPLIDVIFLVLTFFIYAMVLMIPAKVLPMRMTELAVGAAGEPLSAVTISITRDGSVYVDRVATTLDNILPAVRRAMAGNPDAIVYIATEERGEIDRLPIFVDLYGRLSNAGLNIRLVGHPDRQ